MSNTLFKLGTIALGGYVIYKLKVLDKQREIDAEDLKKLYAEMDKVYVHRDAEDAVFNEAVDFLDKIPNNLKKFKDGILNSSTTLGSASAPESSTEKDDIPVEPGFNEESDPYEEQFNDDIDKGFEVPTEPGLIEEEHTVDSEIPVEPGFEGDETED